MIAVAIKALATAQDQVQALAVASPINLYDAAIMVAYFVLFVTKRDFRVLLCLMPVLVYCITYSGDDAYAYTLYSGVNILLSCYFIKRKDFMISIPIITMAIYNLIFALDSFVNSEYKTWIWHNHEIIICVLHAFVMLVFSKKFTSVVDACFSYVHMLWNDCTSNSARTSNAKRQPSEARHK